MKNFTIKRKCLILCSLLVFFTNLIQVYGGRKMKPTHADVSYGKHDRNVMDVWLSKSDEPTPCVMYIHGGGWLKGDKSKVLSELKGYLNEGISVVSINYRYIKQTIVDSGTKERGSGPLLPRGDYSEPPVKEPLEDAARAIQFIRHHAKQWNIEPTRIAVTGGSAGACSTLWLNFHDDLADPNSGDPIKRQSTKPFCVATSGAQTSLDPKQILEWIPNSIYGGHAFGFIWDKSDFTVEIRSFLKHREEVLSWIKEYSPYELVTSDDPPVYLYYGVDRPQKGTEQKDPTHTSNYGALLEEKLKRVGVEYELVHKGSKNPRNKTIQEYLIARLKAKSI